MSFINSVHLEITGVHELYHDQDRMTSFLRYLNAIQGRKVYLEAYRGWDGGLGEYDKTKHRVTDEILAKVASQFKAQGILVAGEMAPGGWEEKVQPKAMAPKHIFDQVSCLNHVGTQDAIIGITEQLARHVDEILLDDWFTHRCYCDTCLKGIREQLGPQAEVYHDDQLRGLIDEQSLVVLAAYHEHAYLTLRNLGIRMRDAAKAINPSLQFNWKLPHWHRDYLLHGLDLVRLADVFDAFWIGTEIREEADEYTSLHVWHLVRSLVGEKLKGTWFDFIHGSWSFDLPMGTKRYREQFRLSALTGCEEIVFCSYPRVCEAGFQSLEQTVRETLPAAREVNEHANQLVGIPTRRFNIKQAMFMADGYLCDMLGNYGISILPVPATSTSTTAIATSAKGELITQWSASHLSPSDFDDNQARDLIFTADAALTWVQRGFASWLGLDEQNSMAMPILETQMFVTPDGTLLSTTDHSWHHAKTVVGPVFQVGKAEVALWACDGDGKKYPVATEYQNGLTRIRIFGLTRYRTMYRDGYPEYVRQLLRHWVGDIIGLKLEAENRLAVLQKVIIAPYQDQIVLVNLNPHPVRFELKIDPQKFASLPLQSAGHHIDNQGWHSYRVVLEEQEMRQIKLQPADTWV